MKDLSDNASMVLIMYSNNGYVDISDAFDYLTAGGNDRLNKFHEVQKGLMELIDKGYVKEVNQGKYKIVKGDMVLEESKSLLKKQITLKIVEDADRKSFTGELNATGFKDEKEVNRYLGWWLYKSYQSSAEECEKTAQAERAKLPWYKRIFY